VTTEKLYTIIYDHLGQMILKS